MRRRSEGGAGGDHVVDDEDRERSRHRTRAKDGTMQSLGASASGLGRSARAFQQPPTRHPEFSGHPTSQELALVVAANTRPVRRRGRPRDDVESRRRGVGDDVGHQAGGQGPRDPTPGPILEPGDHLAHRSVVDDGGLRTRTRRGTREHGTLRARTRCGRCAITAKHAATDSATDGDEHVLIRPWGCGNVVASRLRNRDFRSSGNQGFTESGGSRGPSTNVGPLLSPTPSGR